MCKSRSCRCDAPQDKADTIEHGQTAVFGGKEETGNASFGSVSLVRQGMLF